MPVSIMAVAGAVLAALLLADGLSATLRPLALRRGLTDRPDLNKKVHARPTPYLGGIAIAAGTLLPAVVLIPHWDAQLLVVVVAGAGIAVLGLVDDIRPLDPRTRLLIEGCAATAVVLSGGRVAVAGNWVDPVLTAVWIVVLTNSFNLLDNMDGAASTVGFVTAGFLAGLAYLAGHGGLTLLLLALSAGCLGFLIHNWVPARMFMGDAGSLFIGFIISATTVLIDVPGGAVSRAAELLLVTFLATVDTCLVLISRRRAGRPWSTGGTDHVSHRLQRLGWSTGQVTMTFFVCTALSCLCGLLVVERHLSGLRTLTGAVTIAVTLIWLLLRVSAYALPDKRPS